MSMDVGILGVDSFEERVCDPYCIACGGLVGFEDIYGGRGGEILDDDIELDSLNPLEWGSIYRAAFQSRPGSELRLSGTGRYDDCPFTRCFLDYLKVTWDRESSNISRRKEDDFGEREWFIYQLNFLNSNNEQRYSQGHVVHDQCWILIERMIGPEVEKNLELLLQICRERFHENPYDIHEYQDLESDPQRPTSQPTFRWWNPMGLPINPKKKRGKPKRQHLGGPHDPRRSVPLRDPLNIPDIDRLIRHSAQNKTREVIKRKTRKWSSASADSSSWLSGAKTRSQPYYQLTELPCEIVFLILDNFKSHIDIRNTLMAFNWKVPETYWKSRVPWDLIFELQKVQQPDDLDWKTMGLGMVDLMEQPSLQNRKRVVGLVDEIRRRFWQRIDEQSIVKEAKEADREKK